MPQWGDKGCEYRPDRCNHGPYNGCEWCCMECNTDTHWCPGCGTVSNHFEELCDWYCALIVQYRGKGITLIVSKDVKVWPMWDRCNLCNYDRHLCRGCGAPVRHYNKEQVCDECIKLEEK